MNEMMSDEERKVREERERKKAEVRARLEASSKASKKKGFMTPERKKKLRLLLRKKAAEELKRQQEAKAAERRKVIAERTGPRKNLDDLDERQLQELCRKYYEKIAALESDKYDLEYQVKRIDYDIHELSMKVNDMRGRYMKPPLKKVPKFGVKIERMLLNARKEVGFSVNLKAVKRDQFKAETEFREGDNTPEWSWKKQGGPEQTTGQAE